MFYSLCVACSRGRSVVVCCLMFDVDCLIVVELCSVGVACCASFLVWRVSLVRYELLYVV